MSADTAVMETPEKRKRTTFKDIYHERTNFQFIAHSRRWLILSGTLILISIVAFSVKGLNLGIDFEGGTEWQVTKTAGSVSVGDVRDAISQFGAGDAKITVLGNDGVRVQSKELSAADQASVTKALADYAGVQTAQVSLRNVGPTWGDKVSSKALTALIVFFFVIAIYLSLRFEWRMALAAVLAVVHDIIITVGVYAVTGFEVVPATVVAFLTILGYSLYDTVVVFDKVKDNTARLGTVRGDTYSSMVNRSLNQVLIRSINTSLVALLPVGSLLFVGTWVFGGLALKDFALALFVGLLTGAYSSIFVATPLLAWLKEKEPKYKALRARAAADLAKAQKDQQSSGRKASAAPATVAEPVAASGSVATLEEATDGAADDDGDGDGLDDVAEEPAEPGIPQSDPQTAKPTRGSAAPRGRQQRGKKRK
ncbi:MAG: protein translocase subunit SecF [Acidimicrobiia bacterium]